MKAGLILLLFVCSAVHAELAPLVDTEMNPTVDVRSAKPAAPNALYELMGRVDQLQAEVRQLTGQLEEQANQIAEMKKSQTTMYSDIDARIQSIEKKSGGANSPSALENTSVQEGSVQPEPRLAEPVVAASSATSVPETKQTPVQKQESVQASGEASAPASASRPLSVGDEKQKYQQAYEALRNGHTAQAITEFNALLSVNPKGEYANNAQYWLGEAYRVNQDVDSARKAFNNVVENYPGSAKVPDALLKLGIIEIEQKNAIKAREYLTRVSVDFPNSTAARLAAKKILLLDDIK
jgi:tol-pal system protein YbgF